MALTLNALSDNILVDVLQQGGVGVLPTDTLYGLVCRASDRQAVKRIYELKLRDKKPGTVIASSISQLQEVGLKMRYLKAIEQYWPNPISIIIPCDSELDYLDQGLRTLAVRVTDNTAINSLLDKVGPLLTSSANLPGKIPAGNITAAKKYFGDVVDFYVDGGDLSANKPSTIIRVVDDAIEVLREGAVKINEETGRIL